MREVQKKIYTFLEKPFQDLASGTIWIWWTIQIKNWAWVFQFDYKKPQNINSSIFLFRKWIRRIDLNELTDNVWKWVSQHKIIGHRMNSYAKFGFEPLSQVRSRVRQTLVPLNIWKSGGTVAKKECKSLSWATQDLKI